MNARCSLCTNLFQIAPSGHRAFCSDCLRDLAEQAQVAETYQRRLDAGDINIVPESDADRQRVRTAIRKRLDPATRDTRYRNR